MEWLGSALAFLHTLVTHYGKVPVGVGAIVLLIVLWLIARKLALLVIAIPGLLAGSALGAWLNGAQGWHPLLGIAAALACFAVIFQILVNFFVLRVGLAVIAWPLATLAIWHIAMGALDMVWAVMLTAIGAATVGSLLWGFVEYENHGWYDWVSNLIEDIRCD